MNQKRSDMMRTRWADPEWREKTTARIFEATRGKRYNTQARGQRIGNKVGLKLYLDEEDFAALRKAAL